MKKKNWTSSRILVLVSVLTGLLFVNCSKDRVDPEDLIAYESINDYFDLKKQPEQEYLIYDTGTCPLTCQQGTEICIGRGLIELSNGDTISAPFTLKVVELYSAKDMIYYQLPSVSNGEIMETHGELRVKACKDGTPLQLKSGATVQLDFPNNNPQPGKTTFYGVENATFVDWTTTPTTACDTTSSGYQTNIQELGWVNCGALAGGTPNFKLTFSSLVDNLENVGIFVYIPATNTVIQAYDQETGSIPSGTSLKVIAIAIDASGQLYSYAQALTLSADTDIDVTLVSISETALDAQLDAL